MQMYMSVLQASREHYCIHKTVSKAPNRDEECEKLMRDEPVSASLLGCDCCTA